MKKLDGKVCFEAFAMGTGQETRASGEYFMLGIAVGMLWQTEFSNQLNKIDLENIILKLYKNFPNEITATESAIQPKRKSLKDRMIDNNQAEETVLTDVRSCGILVNDLTRKDYFKFAHKSFLEYQASLYFVESILQDKGDYNIIMNAITSSLDISVSVFKHSQETISFTSEILISKLDLSKSDDPHKVCKRLFSILYPNKFLGKHPFGAAMFDMYLSSPFCQLFLMTPMVAFCMYSLISKNVDQFIETSYWFSPIMLLILVSSLLNLNSKQNGKRLSIWLQCCAQLNMPISIIEKIVPKQYITYLAVDKIRDPFQRAIMRILLYSIKRNEDSK